MRKNILLCIAILMAVGCAEEIKPDAAQSSAVLDATKAGEQIEITVTLPQIEALETRVSLSENTAKGFDPSWEVGDKILVGGQTFTLTEANGKTGKFVGPKPEGRKFDIICPATTPESKYVQKADKDYSHIKYSASLLGVDSFEDIHFGYGWAAEHGGTFRQAGCLRLEINLNAGNAKITNITFATEGMETASLAIENGAMTDGSFTAYIPCGTIEFSKDKTVTIEVKTDTDEVLNNTFYPGPQTLHEGYVVTLVTSDARWTKTLNGKGSENDPYLVSNLEELNNIRNILFVNTTTHFKMTADIDMSSIKDWIPINLLNEPYGIVFDGDGHKITNFTCSHSERASLFGILHGTVKNLTINITSSYCERGINFNNTNGSLLIENVTFAGTAPTYAVNFPGSADGADVTIKNSYLAGNIALNVWGKNMTINAFNTEFVSVDNTEAEDYAAVKLNNDGTTIADGTIINIEGGKIIARNEKGEPNRATSNATNTGVINVSESTEVVGVLDVDQVAIIDYGTNQFYSMTSLQDAIDKVAKDNNGRVKVTKNIELTEGVVVPAGATVEIDLNGKTVSAIDNTNANYQLIKNEGTLVVKNGTLTVKATVNSGWNRYSAVIANTVGGNLTVQDVHIEHLGGTDMAYGIDNLTNGKGTTAVTTIENATVKSPYRAVRQFLNGVEATNELYVKAGAKLEGANKSIFFHDPSKNANSGKLVVEAGAELRGDVYLFVTAGSTEWPVEVSIVESALVGESTVVTGNVPTGYIVTKENGAYVVAEATVANDQASLEAAIANDATIALAEGTYVLPTKAQGKTLKFVGTGDPANTVIATNTSGSYEGCNYALDGSTVEFQNISITTDNKTYTGYARCKATFKNCIINNSLTLYDNCSFEGCTFNVSGDQYNIWTWGAPVATFTNCVFNSDGKAMLLYGQANTHLTINDCVFNDSGVLPDLKAAIEIGNDYNTSYNLVVNNTVVNGYEINDKGINTGTTLWANKNSMGQDKLNVVVDGVDVY